MLHVVGIDPGKLTGIASWTRQTFQASLVPADEVVPSLRTLLASWSSTEFQPRVIVSTERYFLNATSHKKSRQYDAQYLIGAIKMLCSDEHVRFTQYPRSFTKRCGNPERLRRLGMHTPGPDHADSATGQVIAALLEFHPDEIARLESLV